MEPRLEADPDDAARPMFPVLVPGILLLVAIGGAVDLILDRPTSWLSLRPLYSPPAIETRYEAFRS